MNENRLMWQYGLKLNGLKIKQILISSMGLFIALFIFYTAIDFLFFMSINADFNIDNDISNRTISVELTELQIYEPLLDLPMVESFEIFQWDTEVTFLFIRLKSYHDVNAFIEAANAQSLLPMYTHSLSSQAKSLLQVQHFMGVFVKLTLITSVLMFTYFLYKEFKVYSFTLRIMYILGIKMHHLLINHLLKLYSLFLTSSLFAFIFERLLIRHIFFENRVSKYRRSVDKYAELFSALLLHNNFVNDHNRNVFFYGSKS